MYLCRSNVPNLLVPMDDVWKIEGSDSLLVLYLRKCLKLMSKIVLKTFTVLTRCVFGLINYLTLKTGID